VSLRSTIENLLRTSFRSSPKNIDKSERGSVASLTNRSIDAFCPSEIRGVAEENRRCTTIGHEDWRRTTLLTTTNNHRSPLSDFVQISIGVSSVGQILSKMLNFIEGRGVSIGIDEKTEEREKEHCFLNDRPHLHLSPPFFSGTRHFGVIQTIDMNHASVGEERLSRRMEIFFIVMQTEIIRQMVLRFSIVVLSSAEERKGNGQTHHLMK
jgi:hypothetical protein